MHNTWKFFQSNQRSRRTAALSLSTTAASALLWLNYTETTACGATDQDAPPISGSQEGKEDYSATTKTAPSTYKTSSKIQDEWYHGMFPKRQLWRPKYEYPLWDPDWDHKHNDALSSEEKRNLRVKGVTRHIILIRHGQYDESYRVRIDERSRP